MCSVSWIGIQHLNVLRKLAQNATFELDVAEIYSCSIFCFLSPRASGIYNIFINPLGPFLTCYVPRIISDIASVVGSVYIYCCALGLVRGIWSL